MVVPFIVNQQMVPHGLRCRKKNIGSYEPRWPSRLQESDPRAIVHLSSSSSIVSPRSGDRPRRAPLSLLLPLHGGAALSTAKGHRFFILGFHVREAHPVRVFERRRPRRSPGHLVLRVTRLYMDACAPLSPKSVTARRGAGTSSSTPHQKRRLSLLRLARNYFRWSWTLPY